MDALRSYVAPQHNVSITANFINTVQIPATELRHISRFGVLDSVAQRLDILLPGGGGRDITITTPQSASGSSPTIYIGDGTGGAAEQMGCRIACRYTLNGQARPSHESVDRLAQIYRERFGGLQYLDGFWHRDEIATFRDRRGILPSPAPDLRVPGNVNQAIEGFLRVQARSMAIDAGIDDGSITTTPGGAIASVRINGEVVQNNDANRGRVAQEIARRTAEVMRSDEISNSRRFMFDSSVLNLRNSTPQRIEAEVRRINALTKTIAGQFPLQTSSSTPDPRVPPVVNQAIEGFLRVQARNSAIDAGIDDGSITTAANGAITSVRINGEVVQNNDANRDRVAQEMERRTGEVMRSDEISNSRRFMFDSSVLNSRNSTPQRIEAEVRRINALTKTQAERHPLRTSMSGLLETSSPVTSNGTERPGTSVATLDPQSIAATVERMIAQLGLNPPTQEPSGGPGNIPGMSRGPGRGSVLT